MLVFAHGLLCSAFFGTVFFNISCSLWSWKSFLLHLVETQVARKEAEAARNKWHTLQAPGWGHEGVHEDDN